MINPDIVNGAVESASAYFTWRNAYSLYKARELRGVYWPTTLFFTLWGLWNLYYYPALHQWCSFSGGVVLVTGNAIWVVLAILYRKPKIKDIMIIKSSLTKWWNERKIDKLKREQAEITRRQAEAEDLEKRMHQRVDELDQALSTLMPNGARLTRLNLKTKQCWTSYVLLPNGSLVKVYIYSGGGVEFEAI
jgi:hypothetical protein